MKRPKTKVGGLLAATLLASGSAYCGDTTTVATKTIVQPKPESNPLCFFDGKLCIDIQERVRLEVRENNFDFNNELDSLTDDGWLLQRFRIGVKYKPVEWLTFYGQGQDSREWDSDRPDYPGVLGAEGDDAFDVRQAWVEIGNPKELSLKVGRQILSYGDERLIGSFDWNNIGRTFDAVRLHVEQPKWWVDLFASSVVTVGDRHQFNQSDVFNGTETDRGEVFAGAYFSTSYIPVQTTDVYLLYLHNNTGKATYPLNFQSDFFTLGTRWKGDPKKLGGWEYSFEGAFQTGEVRELDLTAFAVHGGVGYNFDCWGKPRLFAEYNYATGDTDPFDDNVETFQNLFPTNHKFYGYMDVFSWQNMHNAAISLRVTPHKTVTCQVDYHAFWIATNEDVWYRANGVTAVRPLNREADSFAGTELDFTVTYKPTKNLAFLAGYSHFFAGDYLKATGRNDDADFGYVQATIEF